MDIADIRFGWHEVMPGRWERGVDEAERFYATLAKQYEATGRMFFAITGHVSVSSSISEHEDLADWQSRFDVALRKSWFTLRYDHPAIASWVEWSPEQGRLIKVYEALSGLHGSELECEWLNDTFQIVPDTPSGQHWCNSDPPAPKMPTLFIIRPATVHSGGKSLVQRDLVLRSPHDVMDGIGTLHLLQHLLRHTSEAFERGSQFSIPSFGDEWKRLNPPLRIALGMPSLPSDDIKTCFQGIVTHNAYLKQSVDILSLPFKQGATIPGKHQRIETGLSSLQSKQLLSACKLLGISVTHVYHAAAAVTLSRIQTCGSSQRFARYINYGLVNLRERCQHPYSTPSYAAAVYHGLLPHSLAVDLKIPTRSDIDDSKSTIERQTDDFRRVLEIVKDFYVSMRDGPRLAQLSQMLWESTSPAYPSDTSHPQKVPPPSATPSVSISSMGVIDKIISPQHGALQIHNPWVTGEELGNGLGLFLGTFRGSLSLSAAYNEAWHDEDEVLNFIQQCHDIVLESFDVETLP